MELEVAELLGAERHERTPERSGYRNGYCERPWDTRVGAIELKALRVRDGSFFLSLLELRRGARAGQRGAGRVRPGHQRAAS
jgi:putative transposase